MSSLNAPDIGFGLLALAAVVLIAAWYEYTANNPKDAKILASIGGAGLAGSAAAWLI